MVVHKLHDIKDTLSTPKDRSKGENIGRAMQIGQDEWAHINNMKERRRIQNRLAQRKYRRKATEAAKAQRAAVANKGAQDSSPGNSSSLTMDVLQGWYSQEGSVISAASTTEGPAEPMASYSSACSDMTVENSLMEQLLSGPPEPALSRSQAYYATACSSLNCSVPTSQHSPTNYVQLAPGTLLPLAGQYNCSSSILPSNSVYQAPPPEIQADAGHGEIDLNVPNFTGQFSGNDFEAYSWFQRF